jgi:glutamate formiminotransferase/formiminotetrahydrofolate cyclodeaminase
VVRARRLPRADEQERDMRQLQVGAATREATRVPMRTAELSADVLDHAARIAPIGTRNAVSDAGVAALLAAAAARSATLNVRINLGSLVDVDEPLRSEAAESIDRVIARVEATEDSTVATVEERIGAVPSA